MGLRSYFIIGAGGVGKSTLRKQLQKELLEYDVHDFDEEGVPEFKNLEQGINWRKEKTDYWIKKLFRNTNTKVILVGLMFPSEIKGSKFNNLITDHTFILLTLDEHEMQKRLKKRGWSEEMIKIHIQIQEKLRDEIENEEGSLQIETTNKELMSIFRIIKDLVNE